jgi:heavy metal-binding protein
MKSFILLLLAMFVTIAAFSQKVKQNADTSVNQYLTYSCTMHPQYVSNIPAKCPVCGDNMSQLSKKEIMKMEVMKLYTCPMDNIICTKPGKCPKCGMDMVELKPKKD